MNTKKQPRRPGIWAVFYFELTFVCFGYSFRAETEFLCVKHINKKQSKRRVYMGQLQFVFLEFEDWPEWFTLDFLPATETVAPRLLLGIAEGPLRRFVADLLPKYRLFDVYQKRLEECHIQADFSFDVDKPWGFGGVLEPYRQSGRIAEGFLEYAISIPQIEKDVVAGTPYIGHSCSERLNGRAC